MTIEEAVAQALTPDDLRRVMHDEIIEYNGRMVSVMDALALHVLDAYLHGVKLRPAAYHFHFEPGGKGSIRVSD